MCSFTTAESIFLLDSFTTLTFNAFVTQGRGSYNLDRFMKRKEIEMKHDFPVLCDVG